MQDRIEKSIDVKAPPKRVWLALTDYREFGTWFGVKLEGPFEVGQETHGFMTHPGYEHLKFTAAAQTMEVERIFAFTWHPYAVDPDYDYSEDARTLVEFNLSSTADGTHIELVESGFSALPEHRYADAIKMNTGGWEHQLNNIRSHVDS